MKTKQKPPLRELRRRYLLAKKVAIVAYRRYCRMPQCPTGPNVNLVAERQWQKLERLLIKAWNVYQRAKGNKDPFFPTASYENQCVKIFWA